MTFKELKNAFNFNKIEQAKTILEQNPRLGIENPTRIDFIQNVVWSNNVEFARLLFEHKRDGEYVFKNAIHAQQDVFIRHIIRHNLCNANMLRYIMSTEDKLGKYNISKCVTSKTTNENAKYLLTLMETHGQIQCDNFNTYVSEVAMSGNMDMLVHLIDRYCDHFDIHYDDDKIISMIGWEKDNLCEYIEYLLSLTPRFGPFNVRGNNDCLLYYSAIACSVNVDAIRLIKKYDESIVIDFRTIVRNLAIFVRTKFDHHYWDKMISLIDFLFSCDYVINKDIHCCDDLFFRWAFEHMNDTFLNYLLDKKRWGYYYHIHNIFGNYSDKILNSPQDYSERFMKIIEYHMHTCSFDMEYEYMVRILPKDYLKSLGYDEIQKPV